VKAKKIRKIMKAFDRSSLERMEITFEGGRISLQKSATDSKSEKKEFSRDVNDSSELIWIHSPLVGTFYCKPTPQADKIITLNQRVRKDETVCIIETMKVLNEIKSPADGIIVQIEVQDGQMVQYHQRLIAVRKDV